jgi:hypothetical protein
MPSSSSIQFFLDWAKERIDEMDAVLVSLDSKVSEVQADSRAKANELIADLRKKREAFQQTVKEQAQAGEAAWARTKAQLESEWGAFENDATKYIENFGKQIEQQQATFQRMAEAQLKACRELADKVYVGVGQLEAERRNKVDAAATRMRADAAAAEEQVQKLIRAGTGSWAALNAALAETRAAFDRANRAAQDAFK